MSRPRLTAVTGGIGSGKSVVSRVLRVMGYDVYDCDREARRLMDGDDAIKSRIASEISADAICADGSIDRQRLAAIVFADAAMLGRLNGMVHAAVRDDLAVWAARHVGGDRLFVETAILYQSGIDAMVDDVWEVDAPEDVRVERVMARNSCMRREVLDRIRAQRFTPAHRHPSVTVLVNDGREALLPQIAALLQA